MSADEAVSRGIKRTAGVVTSAALIMERSRVAAIRFFAELPEDELAAIAGVASEVEVPSGQALATEGRIGHSLFAIESGTADVVIEGTTVRTLGPGDVVGEMAVLASPPDSLEPPEVAEGGCAQRRPSRPRRCD
jgi:CRP-like cAMP-binding protein